MYLRKKYLSLLKTLRNNCGERLVKLTLLSLRLCSPSPIARSPLPIPIIWCIYIHYALFTYHYDFLINLIIVITMKIKLTYLGFSSGSGSLRPWPAGFFSASSCVSRWISASTLPLNSLFVIISAKIGKNTIYRMIVRLRLYNIEVEFWALNIEAIFQNRQLQITSVRFLGIEKCTVVL